MPLPLPLRCVWVGAVVSEKDWHVTMTMKTMTAMMRMRMNMLMILLMPLIMTLVRVL